MGEWVCRSRGSLGCLDRKGQWDSRGINDNKMNTWYGYASYPWGTRQVQSVRESVNNATQWFWAVATSSAFSRCSIIAIGWIDGWMVGR